MLLCNYGALFKHSPLTTIHASFFQPVLQWCLCHGVFEIREQLATFIWWIAYQLQSFLTDWIMHDVLCLLHLYSDIHPTIVAVWLYFLPSELLDVALFLNVIRQENRKARFNAGAEHGVEAKRITSSCDRCSLSVGIVSIRSKNPFGFSFILWSRQAVWIDARKVTFQFPPSHLGNSN